MYSSTHSTLNIPAFIAKLWHMVYNAKSNDLICWNKDGTAFVIKDHPRFCSELLPMYYKHNNMASFIRQLNKYGFHKVMTVDSSTKEKEELEFAHPHFIKDNPELLIQIKRKQLSCNSKTEYLEKKDSTLVSKLLQEVQELQTKQEIFESKLCAMKEENDALWREQSMLRQRHQEQQKIVNKLIQFLLTLVQQTRGLNTKRRIPLMIKHNSRVNDNFMAIKDSKRNKSPLVCEIDPGSVLVENNLDHISDKIDITHSSDIIQDAKENEDMGILITPLEDEPFIVDVTSPQVTETLFLDEPTTSVDSKTNIAVPLQDVSPAIVQRPNNSILISSNDFPTSTSTVNKLKSKKIAVKKTPTDKEDSSLVVSDPKTVLNPEELDTHLDMVQSDLDFMKEILYGDGISLDASTLMGLFNAEDPLSLNLPEVPSNDGDEESKIGNELVAYTNFDMNDILDDEAGNYLIESTSSPRDLNTPIVELGLSPHYEIGPSPAKRIKK